MHRISMAISNYFSQLHMPSVRWSDVIEMIIIAYLFYHILLWIKDTRAWSLLRGILVIVVFVILAALFNMTTILWLVQNITGIAITAIVIILQPELRNAVEQLGQKDFLGSLFKIDLTGKKPEGRFSDKTLSEVVRATVDMARVKTGALIAIEQNVTLGEYERTGINIDAAVSSQLLKNIFEKNTPLHDGAVIIRNDRITSATCYFPLSRNKMDKDLGTRHRAGVGLSEVTDAMVIIVSEETGRISLAYRGTLMRDISAETMKVQLQSIQDKEEPADAKSKSGLFSGRGKN